MTPPHSAPWGGKRCARDGAAQVVIRIAVTAGKLRTGEAQDGLDVNGRATTREQVSGDPKIYDAPIRLREAFPNLPSLDTTLINRGGLSGAGRARICGGPVDQRRGQRRYRLPDGLHQRLSARRQTGTGVDESRPGCVAVQCASCGFLIGKPGEPSQVTPVGAGTVTAVMVCQVPTGRGRYDRLQRRKAEADPSLQMAGAGLYHDARIMPVCAHAVHYHRIGAIQVDQNIAGVLVAGVGVNVYVTPFAVASTKKAEGRGANQLSCRPESFSGKRAASPVVNQTDQIEVAGHGGRLSTNGLPGEKQTAVFHDRNFAVGTNRRTMNFQRTANCVLTVCLSRGGRSTEDAWWVNPKGAERKPGCGALVQFGQDRLVHVSKTLATAAGGDAAAMTGALFSTFQEVAKTGKTDLTFTTQELETNDHMRLRILSFIVGDKRYTITERQPVGLNGAASRSVDLTESFVVRIQ